MEAEARTRQLDLERAQARAASQERAGNIGLWEIDPATGRGTWSPKMYELYYRDPEGEAPTLDGVGEMVHPDDVPMVMANMQNLMEEGTAPAITFRTHPELGPLRYLRAAASKVLGPEGKLVGISGAVADVTQQLRTEGELAASTRKLEALFEHSPYTILGIDRDRKISFVNRFADGYSVEGVLGQRYDRHIAESHREEIEAVITRVFEHGEPGYLETLDVHGHRWESRYVPLTSGLDDEVETALCFTVDVTEQRRLETQLRHSQKLDSLGVLAGGIAHDFNNLLVGILGNAELALMDLSPNAPARTSLEEILSSSHRAADLCRQMLAYSGKGKFVVRAMKLGNVVREMAHLLEVSISKRATLRLEFDTDALPVEGDIAQMQQVVMNLIINASDALGEESGVITASTGTLQCDKAYLAEAYLREDLPAGRYTYLEVSDTGKGMDEATRERMFEPFFTSKSEGRGLGLAAVLGIVRSHRGAIRVYSEPGKGTSIRVLLPATEVEPHSRTHPRAGPWQGAGTMLVVDDEPAVLRLAGRLLEKLGFDVIAAENGAVAVERYRERGEEIVGVLLDMTMPVMDGKTTFAELRKIDPEVRVLLTSGYNEQDATSRFAGKGLAGFLQKPFRVDELISALRELLDTKHV